MADGLGSKIGPRIAEINNRAKLDMLGRSAPLVTRLGMALQEEFFRLTGTELVRTVGPLYAAVAGQAPPSSAVKPLLEFLAQGQGQLATLLGVSGISTGLGSGIGALITNELTPLTAKIISLTPYALLTPNDAAALAARGLAPVDLLAEDAAGQGVARSRFNLLTELAKTTWSPADVLELVNRGAMTEARALVALTRGGVDTATAHDLLTLRRQLISVQDLAAMENRGIVTVAQGRTMAEHTGYTAADFDRYDLLAGEPPDLQTVFLAWRRGILTEADVDRAILQGPLRREWIPAAKAMRYVPLPVEEVANAVNQGHMTLAEATKVADENGYTAKDFAVIVANAGIPPGPQEALDWVSRKIITPAEFRTIFLESRIKNKYIDLYLASRERQLTLAEIRLLYRQGAMTKTQAVERLTLLGFSAENATIVINGASAEKTAKTRDLTRDQVIALYRDRLITRGDATTMLTAMGWDDQEAQWIIDLADLARLQTFLNAALSKTRSQYVARKIDSNEASAAMDALQITSDARDQYLTLWDIERGVVTKELTTAEVIAAAHAKIITVGDAQARLEGQGYSPDDAVIKLKIAKLIAV
jgi:hypothetical protein